MPKVVHPGDRQIIIILTIQIFTVVSQVALASILGVYHDYRFTNQFIPNYLAAYCKNFVMALQFSYSLRVPLQEVYFEHSSLL